MLKLICYNLCFKIIVIIVFMVCEVSNKSWIGLMLIVWFFKLLLVNDML